MGAIAAAFTLKEGMVTQAEKRNSEVVREYAAAALPIQQFHDMEEKQRQMARQAALAASLLEKIPRSLIVANVTNCMPQDVSMLDFELDSRRLTTQAPAPTKWTTTPTGLPTDEPINYAVTVRVTGVAANDVQVAEFIRGLSHSPLFTDVNLVISDELDQDTLKFRHFEVEMTLNNDADVKDLVDHLPDASSGQQTGGGTTATVDTSN
jgi:Tfp pilus assembly protein PilN